MEYKRLGDYIREVNVAIILTLAKHKYPPYTKYEIFKEVFEQAENFKKNSLLAHKNDSYSLINDSPAMAAELGLEKINTGAMRNA